MVGDERKRFCEACKLHVYDLSSMTRHEAEEFLFAADGNRCVKFFRRKDGTILTNDCPVGLRIIRSSFGKLQSAFAAILAFFVSALPCTAAPDEVSPSEQNANEQMKGAKGHVPTFYIQVLRALHAAVPKTHPAGSVTVRFILHKDAPPSEVTIVESSGNLKLDRYVLNAVDEAIFPEIPSWGPDSLPLQHELTFEKTEEKAAKPIILPADCE